MEEIWKDIKGYEGLYQVSNLGKVRNIRNGKCKLLKNSISNGYYKVMLCKEGNRKPFQVHRLVAMAFIQNENEKLYPMVNHKDENKLNARVDNLEWCNHYYNYKYSSKHDNVDIKDDGSVRLVSVLFNPVGKHRPGAINHRITIPIDMINKLNVTKDNRTFDIKVEGKKIILEMVGK